MRTIVLGDLRQTAPLAVLCPSDSSNSYNISLMAMLTHMNLFVFYLLVEGSTVLTALLH